MVIDHVAEKILSKDKQMKALIIGATGATGKDLVNVMLRDPGYTEVVAFVRRPGGLRHTKYTEIITDFDKLEEVSDSIGGDVWFSCMGTTLKAAGTKERQWHIDHDIPLDFAGIARRNGVPKAVLLSAYGASATGKVFYSRVKGALDDAIVKLGFESCVVFRPGFLLREKTDRPSEQLLAHGAQLAAQVAGRAPGLPRHALAVLVQVVGERQQHALGVTDVRGMGWACARHAASLTRRTSRLPRSA